MYLASTLGCGVRKSGPTEQPASDNKRAPNAAVVIRRRDFAPDSSRARAPRHVMAASCDDDPGHQRSTLGDPRFPGLFGRRGTRNRLDVTSKPEPPASTANTALSP